MQNQRVLIDLNSRFWIESRYEELSYIYVHGLDGLPFEVTLRMVKDHDDPGMRVTGITLEIGYGSLLGFNPPKEWTMRLRPKHGFSTQPEDPHFEDEVKEWMEMFLGRDENLTRFQSFINDYRQIQQDPSSETSSSVDESEEDIT